MLISIHVPAPPAHNPPLRASLALQRDGKQRVEMAAVADDDPLGEP
jgi:hypothetical protein